MNGMLFKLATLRKLNGSAFVAIVLGDDAIDLKAAQAAYGKGRLSTTDSMIGLLENWDANFAVLQEIVAFIEKDGLPAGVGQGRRSACAAAGAQTGQDALCGTELSGARRRDAARRHDAG